MRKALKRQKKYYNSKRKKQNQKQKGTSNLLATICGTIIFILVFFIQIMQEMPGVIIPDAEEISYLLEQTKDELDSLGIEIQNAKDQLQQYLEEAQLAGRQESFDMDQIPAYAGQAYVILEENQPSFTKEEMREASFEHYSELDYLERCGPATACVGKDIMPTEERGQIGMIKPSGWKMAKYDIVDGKYLYNRCHLIGYQLTGENANEKNLITGTRYLNVEGMLPFENAIADYVESTGNHVMYRVTPVFEGDNLVASGVRMEALSVEDQGAGVKFHVYVYNVQPGVEIDYKNGESKLME